MQKIKSNPGLFNYEYSSHQMFLIYMNLKTEYALLRNHKGLAIKQNVSRDIDILIKRKEFYKVESKLINIVKDSGFKIFSIYRSDKLDTYVFARVSISKIDLVQFDFFFTSSIFGIQLLNVNDILRTCCE